MIEENMLPPTSFPIDFLKRTMTGIPHTDAADDDRKASHTTSGFMLNADEPVEKLKMAEGLLERVTKYLNALALFLNSKIVFAELTEQEDFIGLLNKALFSKNAYLSLLSAHVMKHVC